MQQTSKRDLSGLAVPGKPHTNISERVDKIGIADFSFAASPVVPWDLAGVNGHRIRASVEALGVELMANLLELNEAQEGTLYILFTVMREKKLPLPKLEDLRAALIWLDKNLTEIQRRFGNISAATIGVIQRRLHVLAEAGWDEFFSEPTFDVNDLIKTSAESQGNINLLDVRTLLGNPRIYTSFLLWLLSDLFRKLPEVGNPEKPKLVFFFDEAHLLFESAPPALLEKLEQVVRLVRWKSVGVYFVTQNPDDIPDDLLGQLGNRVQHALRAFTPRD